MALEPPGAQVNTSVREQFVTETTSVGWPWRLFVFSGFLFVLSFFVYFGLHFGYRSYLADQSDKADRNLDALAKEVSLDEQDRFVNFYSQLVNLKGVLEDHPFASNFFKFLERNTIDKVYFLDADANVAGKSLKLDGVADSFDSLSQQMAVFEKSSTVANVLLDSVGLQGSQVSFKLSINFKDDFLSAPLQ